MNAERHALRALIDALEWQELVESYLSLPGLRKPYDIGLKVDTPLGSSMPGHRETMQMIGQYINQPDIAEVLIEDVRGRLQRDVDTARSNLAAAQGRIGEAL